MKKPLPPTDLAWFDPGTGRPTEIFADYMRSIDARVLREPVSLTDEPSNGEVLTYDATDGVWEPA
jgi:hypothetical protein